MTARGDSLSLSVNQLKETTMKQIQVKAKPRPRHATPARSAHHQPQDGADVVSRITTVGKSHIRWLRHEALLGQLHLLGFAPRAELRQGHHMLLLLTEIRVATRTLTLNIATVIWTGQSHARYGRLIRFSFLILIGPFATLDAWSVRASHPCTMR